MTKFDKEATFKVVGEFKIFTQNQIDYCIKAKWDKDTLLKNLIESRKLHEESMEFLKTKIEHQKSIELIKRFYFKSQYQIINYYRFLFNEDDFNSLILTLIRDVDINKRIQCSDNFYESLILKYKERHTFFPPTKEQIENQKKESAFQAERDYNLNVQKKNIYASSYFQEKKRRNAYNFNRSKKKPKKHAKKGKIHQK